MSVIDSKKRRELGKKGEDLVAQYLQNKGYTISCMNYTVRCGEIDIIAQKDHVRIFVEVKLRTNAYFATSQVITRSKQRKIIATARRYNAEYSNVNHQYLYRFDVALLEKKGPDYEISYIRNAFAPESDWS